MLPHIDDGWSIKSSNRGAGDHLIGVQLAVVAWSRVRFQQMLGCSRGVLNDAAL